MGYNSVWDKVALSFGKVGPGYWNDFGKRLVELSSVSEGARILDIGMGRGASLFPAVAKIGSSGYAFGIDSSEEMVKETQKEVIERDISNATLRKLKAEKLDFEDNYFDNVFCGFGFGYIFFSENKFLDIIRVLKTEGQAAFSIWGVQEDQKWLSPIVNKYLEKREETLKTNVKAASFETKQEVTYILKAAGFHDISVHEENNDVVYKDKDEWWQEMMSNAVRNIFEAVEARGVETFNKFKLEVFRELDRYNKEDGIHFNMPVIYAYGTK